ncbi:SDR family NAD(P)-dependent oxidoreductase [Prescottella soli]|uniref:SDR family NAD(P)-dependent oxidoreductase n=1 Tax=Prescottella soli TaxID=1543852 RepID=A0ABW9FTP9_9NOCA
MDLHGVSAAVTGGASGLGLATAKRLIDAGAHVTIIDLPTSAGLAVAQELGPSARFAPADITNSSELATALDEASDNGGLRALVHCAGIGRSVRVLGRDGKPGRIEDFERVIQVNLVGSFNVLRLAAERMARLDEIDGERGAIVLTASVAAFEGQIGQVNYTAAKAGIVGMTLTAARDLANTRIRVCTIAPGIMDTPLLATMPADMRSRIEATVPNPSRLGRPDEFGQLATSIIENRYLNGETIRLDGGIRMAPR